MQHLWNIPTWMWGSDGATGLRGFGLPAPALALNLALVSVLLSVNPQSVLSASHENATQTNERSSMHDDYMATIRKWQTDRDTRLAAEDGWLSIIALDWLQPGVNRIGTTGGCTVRFPEDSVPESVGTLEWDGAIEHPAFEFRADAGSQVSRDGEAVRTCKLECDGSASETQLQCGRITFWIIRRGEGFAVRAQDPESPLRTSFTGVDRFAIDPTYRVAGTFHRFSPPRVLMVPNVLGYADSTECFGEVQFELAGKQLRLLPIFDSESDSSLFLVFRDQTTERETYGGGRFLYALLGQDGQVEIDFNKAYNPPCAFNPFTTCPLPPAGNDLPVAIRAGERTPTGEPH